MLPAGPQRVRQAMEPPAGRERPQRGRIENRQVRDGR